MANSGGLQFHPDSLRLLQSVGFLPSSAPATDPPASLRGTSPPSQTSMYNSVMSTGAVSVQPGSVPSMMRASQSQSDVGGLHAVMSVSDQYVYIDQLVPGGQLAMNGVQVGDALVSIEGRSVVGQSLRAVKAQLEGPAYSSMELGFERVTYMPDQQHKFVLNVVRTPLVSEDVQIALLSHALNAMKSPAQGNTQDESQRLGSSFFIQKLHNQFLSGLGGMRAPVKPAPAAAPPPAPAPPQPQREPGIDANQAKELERQIQSRDNRIQQLQNEVNKAVRDQVVTVSLVVSQEAGPASDDTRRKWVEGQLANEVAQALNVDAERIEVIGVHTGEAQPGAKNPPLIIDMSVLPPTRNNNEAASRAVCEDVVNQASNPRSALRQIPSLRTAESASIRSPRDWIDRLRATVLQLQADREGLVADLSNAASSASSLRAHRDERTDMLASKNKALEKQVRELSLQLSAEKEARSLQAEALTMQKDTELAQMNTNVTSLTQQMAAHKSAVEQLQFRLASVQAENRELRLQAEKAEGEASVLKNKEQQLQGEVVMVASRHRNVYQVTERALDEARATINRQTIEIEELKEVKEELELAEATIRSQEQALQALQAEMADREARLKRQHKEQMDEYERNNTREKEEFVAHLGAAEGAVLDLRSELEKRMRAQSDLVRKLATQEELTQSLLTQQASDEKLHAKVVVELTAASNKIVVLQDEVKRLAGKNAALEEVCQKLRVEENSWKRVDKLKMERELKESQEQNATMREQLRAIRALPAGGVVNDVAMERIKELQVANERLELENLRRRGELEAAGMENVPSASRNMFALSSGDGKATSVAGPKAEAAKLEKKVEDLEKVMAQDSKALRDAKSQIADLQHQLTQARESLAEHQAQASNQSRVPQSPNPAEMQPQSSPSQMQPQSAASISKQSSSMPLSDLSPPSRGVFSNLSGVPPREPPQQSGGGDFSNTLPSSINEFKPPPTMYSPAMVDELAMRNTELMVQLEHSRLQAEAAEMRCAEIASRLAAVESEKMKAEQKALSWQHAYNNEKKSWW